MITRLAKGFAAILAAAVWMGCGDADSTNVAGSSGVGGSGGAGVGGGTTSTTGTGGGTTTTGSGGGSGTAAECFKDIAGPTNPDYDQFNPVIGSHCKGTNHQDITGIEKVVFLGDSITAGTPPTPTNDFYTNQLTAMLEQKFGPLEMQNCSEWGARTDDLLMGGNQIATCFPNATEPKRTLVVMTDGGNDIAAWAKDKLPTDQAITQADQAALLLRQAIEWFYADPARFPNGVFVVFANVYEYTDATADLSSCPLAGTNGLSGFWTEGIPAIFHLEEEFMKIAVETQTDMIFLLETFCGHGYHNMDTASQCYRGPNTPRWFDLTCIHPTPEGHGVIADLFYSTIDE